MIFSALLIAVLSVALVLGILWLTLRLTVPGEEKVITDAFRRRQS
jgi:hypothetical protein